LNPFESVCILCLHLYYFHLPYSSPFRAQKNFSNGSAEKSSPFHLILISKICLRFFEGSEKFLIINQKNLILILRICLRNFFEVAEKFLKRVSRKKLTFPLARFSALRKDLILISRICLRFF